MNMAHVISVLRKAEIQSINQATGRPLEWREADKRKAEEHLQTLSHCSSAKDRYDWFMLHQDFGGFASQKFVSEARDEYKEELLQSSQGWEFVSCFEDHGPAYGSYRYNLVVRNPQGETVEYYYGNNGANGMSSECRGFGSSPEGPAKSLLLLHQLEQYG